MSSSRYQEITVRLSDIKHLFHEPAFDPFSGQDDPGSGMDQIIAALKPRSRTRKVRAVILLPTDRVSQDAEPATRHALRRFCDVRIRQAIDELALLRWQTIKALQTGLIILAVCLLLSTLFDGLGGLPEILRRFLGEGLLIAGWVSMWHPTELLLHEWWPQWREKQLYERIRDMELRIEAQDGA
jgi:hypothetical protein